ncbi:MAG: hypothetical protein QOG28_4864 [Trebonia sp.]|nr:hypothetical protein [Trebonia sp.]
MTHDFEYISYNDADRIAILENRAAELERRLLAALPPDGRPGRGNVATPRAAGAGDPAGDVPGQGPATVRYAYEIPAYGGDATDDRLGGDPDVEPGDGGADPAAPDGRTEALINHGRSRARPARSRRILAHWRIIAVGAVALLAGVIAALVAFGGGGASWPASVATVQTQVKQACENPDVAAEPSGLNFGCGKDTQSVLWVFSLLTSGDNPGFVDQSTGRKGLEPIQPAQGGDIAWSLNLHHPYNPANPLDSLQVAARAINNIISGATLTSTSGGALVEPGLESKAANCQRYTGSPVLVTRAGYPARCAAPLSGAGGEAALVSDVFEQWMGGTPSQIAQQAGVLFQNAGNPGDPRVQAILSSLPASGG